MRRLMLIACLVFSTSVASAGSLKDEAAARDLAELAMSFVEKGQVEQALRVAAPYLPLPPVEIESLIAQTKAQRGVVLARYGALLDVEFVVEQRVGMSLLRYVYLERRSKAPLKWQFVFYRASEGWVLNNVAWDDQVPALFQ